MLQFLSLDKREDITNAIDEMCVRFGSNQESAKNTASAIYWGVGFTAMLPNLILTSSVIYHESPNPCGEQDRASDGR